MITILATAELEKSLSELPGWTPVRSGKAIEKTFEFGDFSEAFGFMTRTALAAEKADQHPEWSNVYNRVTVTLSTHEAGGVTARDLDLAAVVERFASA